MHTGGGAPVSATAVSRATGLGVPPSYFLLEVSPGIQLQPAAQADPRARVVKKGRILIRTVYKCS